MKVFVLSLRAEFDNDEFIDNYVYDSFEKAHANLLDIIRGWENEELFNTKIFGEDGEICRTNWDDDEVYSGFYSKYVKAENFYIEERDNVVNYLHVFIDEHEVM